MSQHNVKYAGDKSLACARYIHTSSQKLNLIASQIRGMPVSKALDQLHFSKRRVACDVRKVLQSAIANAENNQQLDVDRLFVLEAYVGKTMVFKRFRARARGRVGRIQKFFSRVTIVVCESREEEKV